MQTDLLETVDKTPVASDVIFKSDTEFVVQVCIGVWDRVLFGQPQVGQGLLPNIALVQNSASRSKLTRVPKRLDRIITNPMMCWIGSLIVLATPMLSDSWIGYL